MKKLTKKQRDALASWRKELETTASKISLVRYSDGNLYPPDFRPLKALPMPSAQLVYSALDELGDNEARTELAELHAKVERAYTQYIAERKRWKYEVSHEGIAEIHNGTIAELSDPSGALDKLRNFVAVCVGRIDTLTSEEVERKKRRAVSMKQAVATLARLNCPRDRRTISRWRNGENAPDGFRPELLENYDHFLAWAKIYANREQAKINTNNGLRIDNPKNDAVKRFR